MLKETSSKGVSSLLDLLDDVAKVIPCCVIDGLFDWESISFKDNMS